MTPSPSPRAATRAPRVLRARTEGLLATAALVTLVGLASPALAQQKPPATDGPVIHDYGAVWDIPDPDLGPPIDQDMRVVFEVAQSSERPGEVSAYLNTVARFLNMHVRAGVPLARLHVALVMHGEAAKDALDGPLFRERYGTENRNEDLLRQLADAGVEIYLCGQSAMSRDLPRERLQPYVRLALSAMTAMAVLKDRGYVTVN